ncbi:MAG: hypothetical protein IH941_10295 [Acidobacteria bacterium]|nr:hypothetical protein [Acidobacteriota bacterium]
MWSLGSARPTAIIVVRPPHTARSSRRRSVDGRPNARYKIGATPNRGSASIGQVYRATLHSGEAVVVKIQKPGVGITSRWTSPSCALDPSPQHPGTLQRASTTLRFSSRSSPSRCGTNSTTPSKATMRSV